MWNSLNDGEKTIAKILALCVLAAIFPVASTYAVTGIIVLALIALAGIVVYVLYNSLRNYLAPITRTQAKVIRKQHESKSIELDLAGSSGIENEIVTSSKEAWEAYSRQMRQPSNMDFVIANYAYCRITFEFDNRTEKFRVPTDLYITLNVDDTGLLVYKGEKFMHFIPNADKDTWQDQ